MSSTTTRLRYKQVRVADTKNDQKTPGQVTTAELVSVTQEDLQSFVLSQVKQIIFGDHAGRWFDDFRSQGIPSLFDMAGVVAANNTKVGILLIGALDGVNRTFTTPDFFVQDPPTGKTIEVFHNGRRLLQSPTASPRFGDYFVSSVVGGYNTINLLSFTPRASSVLTSNYQVLP